jgi:DNA-binding PadR family transcriptional regulator
MRIHGMGRHGHSKWPMAAMIFGGGRHGWGRDWSQGWGSGPDGEGAGRRGRGGRSRLFASGELRLVVLALVGEQPRHGYELIKAIEELAGGAYAPSPGVVYPTLNLLTDEGLIIEHAGDGARKAYEVTEAGRKELDGRAEELERLIARLKAMGDEGERHNSPPLKRAIGNLFAAVRNRTMEAGFDRETIHQIAEILDEAARKVERL